MKQIKNISVDVLAEYQQLYGHFEDFTDKRPENGFNIRSEIAIINKVESGTILSNGKS